MKPFLYIEILPASCVHWAESNNMYLYIRYNIYMAVLLLFLIFFNNHHVLSVIWGTVTQEQHAYILIILFAFEGQQTVSIRWSSFAAGL